MCTFGVLGLSCASGPKVPTTLKRERMKIVPGGGKKKLEMLGGPADGCPAEGCPAEGCPAEGSSGRVHRQWGAGFGVSGSVQVFQDENRNSTKTK